MKERQIVIISFFLLAVLFSSKSYSQNLSGDLSGLTKIQEKVKSKRISSADPTGGNGDNKWGIGADSTFVVEISGTGIINHIWITIAPQRIDRQNIILKMYWDGNQYPSVEAPISAFFGNGWDEFYEFTSLPLAIGPRDGTGLNSYFQMPFEKGARIEFVNETGKTIECLYYYIDYVEVEKLPKGTGRFHAWYNHELTDALPEGETEWGLVGAPGNNEDGANNYLFADIKGKGHFVGINYYVHCPSPMWYGEGDDMFFIDGESKASILGTGTEDFFNTSWCPASKFYHPYYGYARVNGDIGFMGRTHAYRFFISDPIYFDKSLKGTIEHGHNNNLTLDISTVAYWYQSEASALPPSPSKELRKPKRLIDGQDIHRWRHEWRKNRGNDSKLWGDEKEQTK